uniref:ATP synthase subunit a n=1 Tax=Brachygobius doriae TaxID=228544 RepID=A0A343AX45_9GOBI|nr:ATP synthase F0 subunit 6 [Brachygobius doriae]APT69160.1 ATP synthase F0 subunit 6 [Brachygobius doriae]
MMISLFDQFMSPVLLGIPLMAIALIIPWLLFPNPGPRWVNSRLLSLQNWAIGKFVIQLMSPINQGGHKWALLLSSLMLFLISINMLGLLPYTQTPTTQLSMNLGLAIPMWLATVLIGMRNQPTLALGHLLPEGTPGPLIPALVIIETISLFIRPIALGVRLTANLTAGHLLIHLLATATLVLLSILPAISLLTSIVLILLTILEVAVAMIQAYVFVLLMSLYLQENV